MHIHVHCMLHSSEVRFNYFINCCSCYECMLTIAEYVGHDLISLVIFTVHVYAPGFIALKAIGQICWSAWIHCLVIYLVKFVLQLILSPVSACSIENWEWGLGQGCTPIPGLALCHVCTCAVPLIVPWHGIGGTYILDIADSLMLPVDQSMNSWVTTLWTILLQKLIIMQYLSKGDLQNHLLSLQ